MINQFLKKYKLKRKIFNLKNVFDKYKNNNAWIEKNLNLKGIKIEFKKLKQAPKTKIKYLSYSLKNNYCVFKENLTGGSKFLKSYISPYTSSVVEFLKQSGSINLINANLDEFGMSGTGLDSYYGNVSNPYNEKHIIGGSSSGSAFLVSKKIVDFSITSDTGDSSRIPASYANIFGFKPSYGMISRHGLLPFCDSFDTPSILSSNFNILVDVFSAISKKDKYDLTTYKTKQCDYSLNLNIPFSKKIKIAYLKETFQYIDENSKTELKIKDEFFALIKNLKNNGQLEISEISFDNELLSLVNSIYCVVSYSESVSCYSNMTGILFPKSNENKTNDEYEKILQKNRKNFGDEFIFRQLMGKYFLHKENYENLYLKSKKIINLINLKITKILEKYDFIISPTSSDIPEKIKGFQKKYQKNNIKNILLLSNFAGLPSCSAPWLFVDGLPVGLHFFSKYKNEKNLFRIIKFFEKNKYIN